MSIAGIKTLILEDYFDNTKKSQYKIQSYMDLNEAYDANNDIINVCEFINGGEVGYIDEEAAHAAGVVVELKEYSLSNLIEEHRERGVYLNVYITDGNATLSLLMTGLPFWTSFFADGGVSAGFSETLGRTSFQTSLNDSTTLGSYGIYLQGIPFTQGKWMEIAFDIKVDLATTDTYAYIGCSALDGNGAGDGWTSGNDLQFDTVLTPNVNKHYVSGAQLFDANALQAQTIGIIFENYGGVDAQETVVDISNVVYTEYDVVPDAYGIGHNYVNGAHSTPDTDNRVSGHTNHTISYDATLGRLKIVYTGAGVTNLTWTKTFGSPGFTGQAYIKCDRLLAGESVSGVRFDGVTTFNVLTGLAESSNNGLYLGSEVAGMNSGGAEYGIQIITPAGSGTIYLEKFNFSWGNEFLT